MTYERDTIRRMSGYTPGEQPGGDDIIKLNTNENPYPPAAAVMEALARIHPEQLRRYPSPTSAAFRHAAASVHGVDADSVMATNGGDELLRLAITTFVEPGAPIGVAEPSYSLYPVLAAVNASPVIRAPLDAGWQPPTDFAERMNREGVNLTFLVNPHAPSGVLLDHARIESIARALDGVLLVDEAYVDFVDPDLGHDLVPLTRKLDNLILLRTLSKGYSLAGLRLGYGMAAPSLINPMATRTRDSYSVDAVAEALGAAALEQREASMASWAAVRGERARLGEALHRLGFEVARSQSNFLLASRSPADRPSANELYQALRERGLFVRYFKQERLADSLRITVGTREQNDLLIGLLGELIAGRRPVPSA